MPLHLRLMMLGALAVAASAVVLLVVPTGVQLGPALVGALAAAALHLRFPGRARVGRRSLFIRCTWCYVVTFGAAAVLMWGAYVIGGEAGGVWSERSITAFLAACLLTVVPAALVPACAARQFRRLDIESSFPAAER